MPMPSGAPPMRRARVALAGSADTELLFDLRNRAVDRVEELRSHLVPAAELADLEQARWRRELPLVAQLLKDRAVALRLVDALGLLGEEEVAEGLRLLAGVGCDRHRVLDQDRLVRDDVVEI